MSNFGIDKEVLVRYYNFTLKVVLLLLLVFFHFFYHIVTRGEHRFEVTLVWECLPLTLNLAHEDRFSFILRPILMTLQHLFRLLLLMNIRVLQSVCLRLIRLFRVFVPVWALSDIIKPSLSQPARLAIELSIMLDLVLVDERKGSRKAVFWIGVEMLLVVRNNFSHLLFLYLPDVVLLVSIRMHFKAFWYLYSSFW